MTQYDSSMVLRVLVKGWTGTWGVAVGTERRVGGISLKKACCEPSTSSVTRAMTAPPGLPTCKPDASTANNGTGPLTLHRIASLVLLFFQEKEA